jgi:small subunit ribosomal protein S21
MAIRIKARAGETAEQMLRRFKKLCEKEGLTKDIKRRQYYEKPSERRRRDARRTETRGTRPIRPGARSGPGGARSGGGGSGGGGGGGRSGGGRPGGGGGGRSGGGRSR